jgi:hypothetical protein
MTDATVQRMVQGKAGIFCHGKRSLCLGKALYITLLKEEV